MPSIRSAVPAQDTSLPATPRSCCRRPACRTAPQPPLTYDDPRLQAFLGVTFDVLYDWNIATGAIYFSEQIDHILGLPAGGFPRTLEGWLERIHPDDHEHVGDALGMSVTTTRRSAASTGCVTATARTASSRTRASSWRCGRRADQHDRRHARRHRRARGAARGARGH